MAKGKHKGRSVADEQKPMEEAQAVTIAGQLKVRKSSCALVNHRLTSPK